MSESHVSHYITVDDTGAALRFYRDAIGAVEAGPRLTAPDASIVHTEFRIGAATIMMAGQNSDFGAAKPRSLGRTPVWLAL